MTDKRVALLAEGVDRNFQEPNISNPDDVALLAEGVDRNQPLLDLPQRGEESPSSRRVWIEIRAFARMSGIEAVALLTEGVERNLVSAVLSPRWNGRPPRRGRG